MKTLLGTLLALGLLSTTASAQWCPPGSGYGQTSGFGHGYHRPAHTVAPRVIGQRAAPEAPAAPIEPAPLPEQQPAPEAAPPK